MPKRKKDWAEQQTDKQIEELEEEIYKEYKEAYENVKKKYDEYSKQLLENDAKKQKQLADGEITEEDYKKWKVQQLMVGSRWKALETNLAQDLTMVDQKAMSIVNGYLPEAYALNFNYSTYELEEGINIDTSFTLYSRETVEKLFREGEIELPKGKVDIPEDMKWNKKHITSAIMQGILSGDDIPTIGERLQQVTDMDRRGAIRNARTLMTGAQNSGRIDAYGRISDMGVEVKKQWLATLDHRTRDSHQELDGQIVDLDKKFSNGLLYPGDPNGEGSEVYNCRCTLVPFFPKYDADDWDFERHDQLHKKDIKYTTYKEWERAKVKTMGFGSKENFLDAVFEKGDSYITDVLHNLPPEDDAPAIELEEPPKHDWEKEMEDMLSWKSGKKAHKLYTEGFMTKEKALAAMKDGTIDDYVRAYFKEMKETDGKAFHEEGWLNLLYKNTVSKFEAFEKEWEKLLTENEHEGVHKYTGSLYYRMNSLLRTGEYDLTGRVSKERLQELIDWCHDALAKASLPEETVVRRGVNAGGIKAMFGVKDISDIISPEENRKFVGSVVSDLGFVSTSPIASGGFDEDYELVIRLPQGTHGMYVDLMSANRGEQELLLQNGCIFRVEDFKKTQEGTVRIFLTLLNNFD